MVTTKKDEMVRDRIVTGVKSSKIREKLLTVGSDLTFAKTLDIARAYEVSHTQCSATEDKTHGDEPYRILVVQTGVYSCISDSICDTYGFYL